MSDGTAAAIRRLAISVSRGSSNNLFQVATLVRAATAIDAVVDVYFSGSALHKLRLERLDVPEWSGTYARIKDLLDRRLAAAGFGEMQSFLRDAKEHGDSVRFWASAETLESDSLTIGDLTPLIDGARTEADFLVEARSADALLAF